MKTAEERFWGKVDTTGDCWMWTGARDRKGYGYVTANGEKFRAHRYAYQISFGPIPAGMLVLHGCDNPSCVRPDHLSAGTYSDNTRDAARKGRLNSQRNPLYKSVSRYVESRRSEMLELREAGWGCKRIARLFGVSKTAIRNALARPVRAT